MCEAFTRNIEKVNAPFLLAAARNPQTCKGYDGDRFVYCPWCGKKLSPAESDAAVCLTNTSNSEP